MAVPIFVILPWVTLVGLVVAVAVQVSESPGARVPAVFEVSAGVNLQDVTLPKILSFTVTSVNVTLPVFFTK